MSKAAVVYWSGTGNTEAMAKLIEAGAKAEGADVTVHEAPNFKPENVDEYDAIAFGCPSMGDEVLEEEIFQPMFNECKPKLKDKKIALFGSYGWGDGEWMREWDKACKNDGAVMVCDFVIANEAPDDEAEAACRSMGAALAKA